MLSKELADRLEDRRFDEPKQVTDRGVFYEQRYDIGGGKQFTDSFSKASDRALDWSTGAHGLRHSYAQERMDELQKIGYDRETALETVSQEMGHFRSEITEVYLR
jgi:integrase